MTRCRYERNQGICHSQTLYHIFYSYILLISYLHTHDIDLLSMPHYFSAHVIISVNTNPDSYQSRAAIRSRKYKRVNTSAAPYLCQQRVSICKYITGVILICKHHILWMSIKITPTSFTNQEVRNTFL